MDLNEQSEYMENDTTLEKMNTREKKKVQHIIVEEKKQK